jgi:hypothetical protein
VDDVLDSQTELKYDIDQLATFVDRRPEGKKVCATFFDGMLTLNRDMMESAMRSLSA